MTRPAPSARRGARARPPGSRPVGRGFTLLEVMVAMAILAMSLAAIFDVVGGALRNHERAQHLELATLLARTKLTEVEARFEEDGFRDFDQTDDGTFEEEGHPEVAWSVIAVKPTLDLGASLAVPDLVRDRQWEEIGRRAMLAASIIQSRKNVAQQDSYVH